MELTTDAEPDVVVMTDAEPDVVVATEVDTVEAELEVDTAELVLEETTGAPKAGLGVLPDALTRLRQLLPLTAPNVSGAQFTGVTPENCALITPAQL